MRKIYFDNKVWNNNIGFVNNKYIILFLILDDPEWYGKSIGMEIRLNSKAKKT